MLYYNILVVKRAAFTHFCCVVFASRSQALFREHFCLKFPAVFLLKRKVVVRQVFTRWAYVLDFDKASHSAERYG